MYISDIFTPKTEKGFIFSFWPFSMSNIHLGGVALHQKRCFLYHGTLRAFLCKGAGVGISRYCGLYSKGCFCKGTFVSVVIVISYLSAPNGVQLYLSHP